ATTSGAAQRTVQPVQEPTTGADPARTGSKAAPGSATGSPGGDVGANTGAAVGSGSDQPVQVPTTGADPMRTGSKGVSGSATGSPAGGAGSERRRSRADRLITASPRLTCLAGTFPYIDRRPAACFSASRRELLRVDSRPAAPAIGHAVNRAAETAERPRGLLYRIRPVLDLIT